MSETIVNPKTRQNLLLYKVGVLGGTPLDFPERLAEELDADLISSDWIRKQLLDRIIDRADKTSRKLQSRTVQTEFKNLATPALHVGDVIGDIFFNSPKTRLIPQAITNEVGGLAIALNIHTPLRVAKNRVRQWADEEAFILPLADWEVHPVAALKAMIDTTTRPTPDECIDHIFTVNGFTDSDGIVDQVMNQLDTHGLLED